MRWTTHYLFAIVTVLSASWSAGRMLAEPRPAGSSMSDEASSAAGQETSDTIGFFNGDRLHGRLVAFSSASNGLKWSRADVAGPIGFGPADVAFVALGGRADRAKAQASATVNLANKDAFGCSLVGIDAKSVVVESGAMGRMTLNRNMVTTVTLRGGAGVVVYEGPNDATEWAFSNTEYPGNRVDRGVLSISYGIAEKRQVAFPELAEVRFSAAWRYPSVSVLLLGETSGSSYASGYHISVQGSSVSMYKKSRNTGDHQLGSANIERVNRGMGSSVFQVFINRKAKTLTLMIDGETVRTVTDTGDIPTGTSLAFSRQMGGRDSTRISAIRVAQWDGRLPSPDSAAPSEVKEDVVRLKNGDKLTGKLESVAQGKISVTTSFASLSIPVENVEEIAFSSAAREMPRRNKMDVRVLFAQYGSLTAELGTIEGGAIQCRSESFGTVSIPLDAVRKIEFNIYRERPTAGGDSGGGVSVPDIVF